MESHHLPGRLLDLSLRDLPGIGRNMEQRLHQAGITTVKAFWNLEPKHARQIWHSVEGERFWYALRGVDVADPPETERRTVGHSHVLSPKMRPRHKAYIVARRLTIKAATRLRRLGFYASAYHLYVRFDRKGPKELTRWQGHTKLPPTQNNFTFLKSLHKLWTNMSRMTHSDQVIQVGLALYGLTYQNDMMPDMFQALNDPVDGVMRKHSRLSCAMDHINEKYGLDTIVLGTLPEPMARHTGSKIAFTRIPEKAEFHE